MAKGLPPLDAEYQLIVVPVALKLPTVEAAQKFWVALPIGAGVIFTVAVTSNLSADSQPDTV